MFKKLSRISSNIAYNNDSTAVIPRVRYIKAQSMSLFLQQQESGANKQGDAKGSRIHANETVHYIAIEQGTSTDGSIKAGITTQASHSWTEVKFEGNFKKPYFLSAMQTTNGSDTANVRYKDLTSKGAMVVVQEEQSHDAEVAHALEDIGWIVIAN